jgi:hypothetical protein
MSLLEGALPISQREMLREWATAEAANEQRWHGLGGRLRPALAGKLTAKRPLSLTDGEWAELEQLIAEFRSPLLRGLLPLQCKWVRGTLALEQVAGLEMMNWPDFVRAAGSRKLIDLLPAIEGHRIPGQEDFIGRVLGLAPQFDLAKMKGCLIAVSRNGEAPYRLVEGFSRAAAILLGMRNKRLAESRIPAIVGSSARLAEWHFYTPDGTRTDLALF